MVNIVSSLFMSSTELNLREQYMLTDIRVGFPFQKGAGYHLDLLVVGVMLGVCSVMGLPWFVAATVLSISHVNSLKVESECSAPGEQPKFLGIREQRVTGLMIFILMGLSVFMTSVLKVKSLCYNVLKIFFCHKIYTWWYENETLKYLK